MKRYSVLRLLAPAVLVLSISALSWLPLHADNQVLGEIQFTAGDKPAKTAGVWVDGQYVGYLKELKGSKRILLLPGEHQIIVREAGYQEFKQKVTLGPGEKFQLNVLLAKDPSAKYSSTTAQVKISVNPDRAAVFLDGMYAGHAHEFGGAERAMLVSPGKHKIEISLPGYESFQTEIKLAVNQKYEIKTDLPKSALPEAAANR